MTVLEDATFTPEQIEAIGRREGDLFLDAAAGSGKTAVLVERFVQAVLQDGVEVGAILTITFTDKAANPDEVARARGARRCARD
jgi:ATP-dependent helicase/nuclease subunit A